ncbi:MAG TPA: hypothetical protein VJ810_24005 [Blastocatellia bacterium]|nr:hypothetical protein [Blastocatellia bacterium]
MRWFVFFSPWSEQVTDVLIALVEAELIVILKSSSAVASKLPGSTAPIVSSATSIEDGFFHSAERGVASEPIASCGLIA